MPDATSILNEIAGGLNAVADQIVSLIGDDNSFMQTWGWNCPAINRHEFAEEFRDTARLLQALKDKNLSDDDFQAVSVYPPRIQYFQGNVIGNLPGGNAPAVWTVAQSLLEGIRDAVSDYVEITIHWDETDNSKILPAAQAKRLRLIDRNIGRLLEDSGSLDERIIKINEAHAAAEALPTDLDELNAAKKAFYGAIESINTKQAEVEASRLATEKHLGEIVTFREQAESQVRNIDAAYSAATTQGLGAAFGDKSKALKTSLLLLSVALIAALGAGGFIAWKRMDFAQQLMTTPNVSLSVLWSNALLTAFSLGAPIWMAWVLTKQIGQRFRLAEDYDYKASMAKAYEGYRREASHVDPELSKRLFALALDRLSEEPLRHVERENHGTPFQEIASAWRNKRTASVSDEG